MATKEQPQSGTTFNQQTPTQKPEDHLGKDAMVDKPSVRQKEKKIGHRRVDASTGQTTYKKTPSSALSGSIQRGISHTVAGLSSKPERDVLMQDFQVVETISFPREFTSFLTNHSYIDYCRHEEAAQVGVSLGIVFKDTTTQFSEGSSITPAHHFGDFTFRTYAPTAFRYFRDLFGIRPDDYMLSVSQPLTELSNPGASGSLFFVTQDDEFIIKTVQHKEAEFLQKLLPGYYMNLVQNPRTLLPKFYGLYCVQAAGKNIRVVVMNNLLPRKIPMHLKFDLKGSTYKRKASKHERAKTTPVFKDLDLLNELPGGLLLEPEIYSALIKTMQRDCLVLQSFKIMDYSLLLAIHNIDQVEREKISSNVAKESGNSTSQDNNLRAVSARGEFADVSDDGDISTPPPQARRKANFASQNAVMSSTILRNKYTSDLDLWSGGIPAKNTKGDRLQLFCGIIDILQCYKLKKKVEHTFKSMIADGDTVSVHKPAFYCKRFQDFMTENLFKKPAMKVQPSNRLKLHPSRRVQHPPIQGLVGTSKDPAESSAAKRHTRPDLLPNDSPRSLTSRPDDETRAIDETETNITPKQHQGGNKETTFNADPGSSGDQAQTSDKFGESSLDRGISSPPSPPPDESMNRPVTSSQESHHADAGEVDSIHLETAL